MKKATLVGLFIYLFASFVVSQGDLGNPGSSDNAKVAQLEKNIVKDSEEGSEMSTNFGTLVGNDTDTLKAGERGPSLLQDFIFREKMTHFDHERIPERVVHARGFGVHGYFELFESLENYTKANLFTNTSAKVPVFVRFSTVLGFRGSLDTARDIRGFAVKFYTSEGNFDLVGNNIPVFFIQDAIKFPDLIHAGKPEPHNEIPQASTAHDNFWDFISFTPESAHVIMWVLSDRGIPRSYRMMEGFGVHSFILVNAQGNRTFVKFHWKPKLGIHSLVWDESQKLGGVDPDFHRNDLYNAIESGAYPEWELGVQIVDESDEDSFDFDLLDATKIIPEELVPVKIIGRMVLNRNVDNFFAETEQVAMHTGHLVPGIEASDDPLLQGRMFSYTDTQLIRLGGPNFEEIPINRPLVTVKNNQRDGYHRMQIDKSKVNYSPNRFGLPAVDTNKGYNEQSASVENPVKVRGKGPKFFDYFSQARTFFDSITSWERQHLIDAAKFELGKVKDQGVKERMVEMFSNINTDLATQVASAIGVNSPSIKNIPTNITISPAVSQNRSSYNTTETRQVAFLIADGFNSSQLTALASAVNDSGAVSNIVSVRVGGITGADNSTTVFSPNSLLTTKSVKFDAVVVVGGQDSVNTLKGIGAAKAFISEAFKHYKPIAVLDEAISFIQELNLNVQLANDQSQIVEDQGFISGFELDTNELTPVSNSSSSEFGSDLWKAIASHRFYNRDVTSVPA